MRIYTGYDSRESLGWHVFAQSVIETTPGAELIPLAPVQGDGTNAFTYSRFRVPALCGYRGWALFLDGVDMLARANLNDLMTIADPRYGVMVVKHDYRTRHPRKYVGTALECANEDYPRKNWSSVILWNCGHYSHQRTNLHRADPMLHRFCWVPDNEIGELPHAWNWLADEYGENQQAKLVHWTAGMPGFEQYADSPMADEWRCVRQRSGC